jgi:hypothetical protein
MCHPSLSPLLGLTNLSSRQVLTLLEHEADVNIADHQGRTPLHAAASVAGTVRALPALSSPSSALHISLPHSYPLSDK